MVLIDRHHPELLFGFLDQLWREHIALMLLLLLCFAALPYIGRRVFLLEYVMNLVLLRMNGLMDLVLFLLF